MKKYICYIMAVLTAFTTIFSLGCSNSKAIRINEVTHSVFYAPFYIAMEQGYFAEEGIDIILTNGGGSDASMTALISGSADIGLMGPETAIYVYNEGKVDHAVIFAQLTRKDGSFLIGRNPMPNFHWSDLTGAEIIGGRKGGSPAMALEHALTKNSLIDKTNITLNYDVKYDLITAAFESGTGDYCTMFEPAASNFIAAGKGYRIASVGEESGDMPFTCFMATKSYIAKHSDKITSFVKAIQKAMDYLWSNDSTTVANALKGQFADTSVPVLASAIEQYKIIEAYMDTPYMQQADFEHLQDVIIEAGVMTQRADFTKVVNNSFVQ